MNNNINDGGPAFPHKRQIRCNGEVIDSEMEPGMSLRDYFAAAALQGILADGYQTKSWGGHAECAYQAADAMLKARESK